jgi:hypothetical protein
MSYYSVYILELAPTGEHYNHAWHDSIAPQALLDPVFLEIYLGMKTVSELRS